MKCPYCGAEAKTDVCPKCFAALKKQPKAEEDVIAKKTSKKEEK